MHSATKLFLAFLLGTAAAIALPAPRAMAAPAEDPAVAGQTVVQTTQNATTRPTLKPVAAKSDIPFPRPITDYESQTEQQLLTLANQSRKQSGAPPLQLDAGLSEAARIHAQAMLEARQLSHQFDGEPSLPVRLADRTDLQLDQEGENVALDYSAEGGHQHLMLSPPHRANLLNPAYNVVGLGVVRSGDRLYIVQDFGHALPNYSSTEVKDQVAAAVNRTRHEFRQSALQRRDLQSADAAACSMAQADKLGTAPVSALAEKSTVLTYTSLHPEALPAGTGHALTSHNLHTFSIGECYSRTNTYPTGVYWLVLSLD